MMDYLVTNEKLLWLAEYEHLDKEIILNIYNDYYVTCRDMKKNRIPQLDEKDQAVAYKRLNDSLLKFKKNFNWKYLKGASVRTKIKFGLFLMSIRCSLVGGTFFLLCK